MGKFYVTTSIAYVNGPPHIGHAMELIQGDVLARYHRQLGDDVWFLTGTDEHGAKIDRAAANENKTPQGYADEISLLFKELTGGLNLSVDQFIRTTDATHKAIAQKLWKTCAKDIYKKPYKGWYCVGCETYYTETEIPDHICPIHKTALEFVETENYFFKLSNYNDAIKQLILSDSLQVVPVSRKNEMLALLERGLEDVSVSREISQLEWGIGVPGDPGHVMYVWFDALTNYISALGYPDGEAFTKFWPADVHVIGKDILRHHAVLWIGMLLSAGIAIPKTIYAHGFISSDGHKMSKSLGNVVGPYDIIGRYNIDALRYYLLRAIPSDGDGDFTWERMEAIYNADLANELGNLLQRVSVMVTKYFAGVVGEVPAHMHDSRPYTEAMADYRFDRALEEVWQLIKGLNQYLEEEKPWSLAKTDTVQLAVVLRHAVSDLDQISILLVPFLPITAAKIAATFAGGTVHPEVGLLFPKADVIEKTEFTVK